MTSNNRLLVVSTVVVLLTHRRAFILSFALVLSASLALLFSVSPRYSVRMEFQQPVSATSSVYQAAFDRSYLAIVKGTPVQTEGSNADSNNLFKFAVAATMDDSIWWDVFKSDALGAQVCGALVNYGCFEDSLVGNLTRGLDAEFPQRLSIELLSSEPVSAEAYLRVVLAEIQAQSLSSVDRELEQLRLQAGFERTELNMDGGVLDLVVSPFVATDPVFPKYAYGIAAAMLVSLLLASCLVWFVEGWRQYADVDRIEL